MDFMGCDPDTDFRPLDALGTEDAAREAEALQEGIRHHDWLYDVKNAPAISDAVYDRLFERLQDLEARWPERSTPDSPTRKVGAPPVEGLSRARHRAPMLSLRSGRLVAWISAAHPPSAGLSVARWRPDEGAPDGPMPWVERT